MNHTLRSSLIATLVSVATVLVAFNDLAAQRLDRRPGVPGQQAPGFGAPALERQFRERLAEVVRRRLNLDDSQMRQLRQVNDRVENQRVLLLREERRVRAGLRAEMVAGDAADQARIAQLLDASLRIQRRRLDLIEQEQQALQGFMTPLQRAQYFVIQDDLRRRLEELRQQRQQRQQGRPGGPPPGRPAPLR